MLEVRNLSFSTGCWSFSLVATAEVLKWKKKDLENATYSRPWKKHAMVYKYIIIIIIIIIIVIGLSPGGSSPTLVQTKIK